MAIIAENEVIGQLINTGYWPYVKSFSCDGEKCVRGELVNVSALVHRLRFDSRFIRGVLHQLHDDVGEPRTEFRSIRKKFGRGSLQWVINTETGVFYADIDAWSPYDDVVGFVGHTGEVLKGVWRKLRGKKDGHGSGAEGVLAGSGRNSPDSGQTGADPERG